MKSLFVFFIGLLTGVTIILGPIVAVAATLLISDMEDKKESAVKYRRMTPKPTEENVT